MIRHNDVVSITASEVALFIKRRAVKLSQEIGSFLNINPFLLAAISGMHEITDQKTLTEFLLAAHLATGHSTSFGKMIDERLLPLVFGTKKLNASFRRSNGFENAMFDDIDHIVSTKDGEYLLSLKAGSWTIQHGQAMELYTSFKKINNKGFAKDGIVVGVFYGNETLLTNKYDIVRGINRRHQSSMKKLEFVHVKAGKEFWSWLNDGQVDTQDWVMEGIRKGAEDYLAQDSSLAAVFKKAPQKLQEELMEKYNLDPKGSLDWYVLLHAVNDLPKNMDSKIISERKKLIEASDSH